MVRAYIFKIYIISLEIKFIGYFQVEKAHNIITCISVQRKIKLKKTRTDAEASNTRRGFLVWIGPFVLTERTPGI